LDHMAAKFRVMGTNDDASHCECCGRQGLRRVVWMQPLDEDGNEVGVPIPFGRVCAAKAAGWGYGSASAIETRIAKEMVATRKHYESLASLKIKRLIDDGELYIARIAYGFDMRSATYNFGPVYVLREDASAFGADLAAHREILKQCRARMEAKHPVCRCMHENLPIDDLKRFVA